MIANGTLRTYRVPQPFERALQWVRDSITRNSLSISYELDVTRRIRRELGIALAPCRVLHVDEPLLFLQAVALRPEAAAWLPLRVVVAGYGPQTLVHVLDMPGAGTPVNKILVRISRALDTVAMREIYYQSA